MALGPRLDLRQSQSLVMTPQLQQAIKLLALSNLEIETFIGDALEANPLLEAGEVRHEDGDGSDTEASAPREESAADQLIGEGAGEADAPLDINTNAMDRDRDTGDGEWGAAGAASRADDLTPIEDRRSSDTTLAEHLHEQVGAVAFNAKEEFLARNLVDRLDEAGYLRGDLRQISADLGVALTEMEDALELIHALEPTGVGARDLAECLALQAKEANRYDPCMQRLIENLDLVARGEVARLKRMCDVDDEDFADMLSELREYDPKPGLAFGGGEAAAVVPDILLRRDDQGHWKIALNQATLPRLVVNRSYFLELREGCTDKDSKGWLKEKLSDANWLIKALDQRQKTILAVSSEIVKKQAGFFRQGVSELRPLTLREVAEEIEMHESTVSRVTSNKYLHCDRGTFELKYFFTSGVGSADGEGASSESVKARIKALTDAEDPKKILSDDKLVELLKAEGFDIARRTVAKYREAMGIGSSVQRRRAKKLAAL
ncbi:RNA polymerase factor sigma-54 [Parerythrobacter jejuensis]|uniref:RNA polymerase sigma-54 factor n=1 Tax=Parerythrobacter jejuensis TaxID=795812 RepID=A0A845AW24_9SPHN|nr:RNA polymerase factor sigma-54 [Parerythrobacter jejuensis]MXP30717.1 RNA polymerase factor sigma-54 [Parerythrobacter jejuensis]MXP33477.1 RNA polymerase factor sigma-54 [Parerythrobacter jejuensis]